jgi:hypothetical protein
VVTASDNSADGPQVPDAGVVALERIARAILFIRGQKVMLDSDLAALYGVPAKVLNRAVARNRNRFPVDFMFQLTPDEFRNLRCQIGTSSLASSALTSKHLDSQPVVDLRSQSVTPNSTWGGRRYQPYAFTEQGVAMLSGVLNSDRAVEVNISIMRAFVRLRELLASHADLALKFDELEQRYDAQFRVVFDALRQLTAPPKRSRRRIGFGVQESPGTYRYEPLASAGPNGGRP